MRALGWQASRALGWRSRTAAIHLAPATSACRQLATPPERRRFASAAEDSARRPEAGGGGDANDDADGGAPATSAGSRFLGRADEHKERRAALAQDLRPSGERLRLLEEIVRDPEAETEEQLKRLVRELPGHASVETAFLLHRSGKLTPKVEPLDEPTFRAIFVRVRTQFRNARRLQVYKRRKAVRNYMRLNAGYSEDPTVHMPEEEEFRGEWRTESMVEDYWKAEYYQSLQHWLKESVPEAEPLASRADRVADIAGAAVRKHIADSNRPVLTHELADFENAYMMKKSAIERILHERCVRNQLDERCLPRLVERMPDLVKLRAQAPLPPEALEPLAAFRGDVRWHFDPQERLSQKLEAVDAALEAITSSGGDAKAVTQALPENQPTRADQLPGVQHPFRNHLGFTSAVPHGVAGGSRFGQPETELQAQLRRMRYPTLQRVAHTLPKDPKWRAHVVRSIRVLERSRNWDFQSKLRAVNTLKEVYDNLRSSSEYGAALDEKLPVNRVESKLHRRFAPGVEYVKTYPKSYRWKKTNIWYNPAMTSSGPVKKAK